MATPTPSRLVEADARDTVAKIMAACVVASKNGVGTPVTRPLVGARPHTGHTARPYHALKMRPRA